MDNVPASLVVGSPAPQDTLATVRQAEAHGVPAVWSTVAGIAADPITLFGAAAVQTSRVCFGTAIVPTYPRHPAALAAQALALAALAPDRFRLGIGPSHQFIVEGMLGIPFTRPLDHLREYMTVLRALLWDGAVDFKGTYYQVKARLAGGAPPPRTPIPIAALRAPAFHLAGAIADGAISWLCPVQYLVETALPALQAGAAEAGRPTPPLIGHVLVAMSTDQAAVRAATQKQFGPYARAPFYARMFADAGFPIGADFKMPDALIDELVVSGDAAAVASRLRQIRAAGIDEVMVSLVNVADPAAEEDAAMEAIAVAAVR